MAGCSMLPLPTAEAVDLRQPLGACPPGPPATDFNTALMWLYKETTALFPSIYLPCPPPSHHPVSTPEWCTAKTPPGGVWNSTLRNIASVDCQMEAARATAAAVEAATGSRPAIYAFGWMDYYDPNGNLATGLFLSEEDVSTDFARPASWGADGTVIWGESEDTFNASQCNGPTSLGAFINSTAGAVLGAAVEAAATW